MINYTLITKPGIILGNLITLAAGFWLASKGAIDYLLFFETLIGLGFIIASACVINNVIDKKMDAKMERTKNRPIAQGKISETQALFFATLLYILGNWVLFYFTNPLSALIANLGFWTYVALYSPLKSRTVLATAIGSIAGAVPPVVGYTAVANRLDLGALLLFLVLVLWQMPHFFSIALYRLDDYSKAKIPLLPVVKGVLRTKIHMVIYVIAFLIAVSLLTFTGYTGNLFLAVSLTLGTIWLFLTFYGFSVIDDREWGKQMFRFSLVLITIMCLTLPFDVRAESDAPKTSYMEKL